MDKEFLSDRQDVLERVEVRLEEISKALSDNNAVMREMADSLKDIHRTTKDGGLAHDICMGVRHGLFGKNAEPDSSIHNR